MWEESGIKDHFKDIDMKGWIEQTGAIDHMQQFFGDDCDIKAVFKKNFGKLKEGGKSFAKQMPGYIKSMKDKIGGLGKAKGAAGGAAAAAGAASGGGGGGGAAAAAAAAAAAGGGKGK